MNKINDCFNNTFDNIKLSKSQSNDLNQRIILGYKKRKRNKKIIFSILVIVYYHFAKSSYNDYKELDDNVSNDVKKLQLASFIGSLFVLISGIIFLYIAICDDNIDVEIAFN